MPRCPRTRSAAGLLSLLVLATGCGGGSSSKPDAAEASASAAIAALSSKLAALTSTTPAATTSTAAAPPSSGTAASSAASSAALPVLPSVTLPPSPLATPASSAPAPPPTGLAAAKSQANAALGGALDQLDVSKQCSAIPIAQVQVLIKATVGPAANNPLQCGWKGTDLHVSLSPNDTDLHNYKDLAGSGDHALPGLGDVAAWSEPVPGSTLPNVNAHKGSLTCYVEASDVALSTIPHTGSDPFFKITDADSLAYATQEAKLCADIFAVSKT